MSILKYANKQVTAFINSSLGNSPLLRPERFPFIGIPNLNVSAVRWSVKYIFAPNSPIFQKNAVEEQQRDRQWQSVKLFKQTHLTRTLH